QVRTAGGAGIVTSSARGGWPSMKIARPRKRLPDQARSNYHSVLSLDQLAVSLFGEDQLRESCHQQRVQNSQQNRRRDRHEYCCDQIFLDSIFSIPARS